ncbi:UDP-2,4-diacetamido-2,4,6-trideoxy-beta-L-altropyranose hydrolase [Clostridium tetani]|uniref:UDP-2,4-diacetamido-2,4, 6-trideoxy-beta-L-altropyranose hydrolase n=1 Tax=Clostridium tetani TaxID=1513 RepID=A0A4Q0VA33_CLOTA|nr:UDP-2,4-diacetamido-2,4,6-trideoxy-beta-L-altropyranose hydrolase [Clostridium tetani]RXI47034.1 UDP-2,4-diacetamido-2,4,6-trideoxy-beta-L-altropyranose hydrolase [Clostridium tetani]
MRILFRVDGGECIGMGHIMRTLVLAKELSKKYDVKYVCLKSDKYIKGIEKVENDGIEVIKIDEIDEIDCIKRLNGNLIIIDKYGVNKNYFEALKERIKVVYFDDNNDLDFYPVDMIINHNPYGSKLRYNTFKGTKLLLGSRYTIIRQEFRENIPITIKKHIENILITLGGSDDFNITEDIIRQLNGLDCNLHVIIGPAFKYKNKLKGLKNQSVNFYENANISKVMKKCDLAVSSCGSTLYELCFLGIPVIGLIVANNQKKCGDFMNDVGAIDLSEIKELKDKILKLDYNKRLKMREVEKNLVDGKGVFRVKEELERYDK